MLKKDKNKLKLILSMLFYSANYFRIKEDGTIFIKKHWWSLRKLETTVEEIFNSYIPSSLGIESSNEVVKFQEEMAIVIDKSINYKIAIAFNHVSSFVNDTDYKGCMLDWDFKPTISNRIADFNIAANEYIKEICNQIIMEINFKYPMVSFAKGNIIALKAMPSTNIISIQEILSRQRDKVSFEQIGRVITGDPEFDSHVMRIYRLVCVRSGYA